MTQPIVGTSIVRQIGPNQTVIRAISQMMPAGLTQQQQIQWLQQQQQLRQKQIQQAQVR